MGRGFFVVLVCCFRSLRLVGIVRCWAGAEVGGGTKTIWIFFEKTFALLVFLWCKLVESSSDKRCFRPYQY